MSNDSGPSPPWPESNGIWATYDLHCHCGAVKYKMRLSPPLYEEHAQGKERYVVVECDCSYCERNGLQCVHPLAENLEFTQGVEDRKTYLFATKKTPQWFCGKCGSNIGTDLRPVTSMMGIPERISINVRMLKDYDSSKLLIKPMPMMKSIGPKYEV